MRGTQPAARAARRFAALRACGAGGHLCWVLSATLSGNCRVCASQGFETAHFHFETSIFARYCLSDSPVGKALMEMYQVGVLIPKVEAITEALYYCKVSTSTIGLLNLRIFERVEAWRNRLLDQEYSYVFVDVCWFKRT